MRWLALPILFVGCGCYTAAEAQPVANLPLTCPNAANIGQPQNNCSGLTYQRPTSDQLIVLRSNGTWIRAANLASSDTLAVCSLPVEPGTYSSCKDAAGVRRIAYLAKSQVFGSTTSPPSGGGSGGGRVLDLTAPVVISESGSYRLDKNWNVEGFSSVPIEIKAPNVTLDLAGFELSGNRPLIVVDGSFVTMGNGRLRSTAGTAIMGGGEAVLVERMRITVEGGNQSSEAIDLYGARTVIADSFISAHQGGVFAERGVTVRNNIIVSESSSAVFAQYGTYIVENQLVCSGTGACLLVHGHHNFVRDNVLSSRGIAIRLFNGSNNQLLDNAVLVRTSIFEPGGGGEPLYKYFTGDVAIEVQSYGTLIRGNYVEPLTAFSPNPPFEPEVQPWRVGLRFLPLSGNNRYGDNLIGGDVPFDLGATVQVDLGGNQPLTP